MCELLAVFLMFFAFSEGVNLLKDESPLVFMVK